MCILVRLKARWRRKPANFASLWLSHFSHPSHFYFAAECWNSLQLHPQVQYTQLIVSILYFFQEPKKKANHLPMKLKSSWWGWRCIETNEARRSQIFSHDGDRQRRNLTYICQLYRMQSIYSHSPKGLLQVELRAQNIHPGSSHTHSILRTEWALINVCPWRLERFSKEAIRTGISTFPAGATFYTA